MVFYYPSPTSHSVLLLIYSPVILLVLTAKFTFQATLNYPPAYSKPLVQQLRLANLHKTIWSQSAYFLHHCPVWCFADQYNTNS